MPRLMGSRALPRKRQRIPSPETVHFPATGIAFPYKKQCVTPSGRPGQLLPSAIPSRTCLPGGSPGTPNTDTKKGKCAQSTFPLKPYTEYILSFFCNYFERNFYRNFLVKFNHSFVVSNFFYVVFNNDNLTIDVVTQLSQFISNLNITY